MEPRTFDLGTHTVEILEDGGVLLMENTTGNEVVQLNADAAYYLSLVLSELFRQPSALWGEI
jgi:hypothetical protein